MNTKQIVAAFYLWMYNLLYNRSNINMYVKTKKLPPPKKIEVKPINDNGFNTIPNEWKK